MRHITKLSKWDIQICEGHNARMSSLYIPVNVPVLVTATHASLTELNIWDKLPTMDICHYDEVHRITGEEFHAILPRKLVDWRTRFLTGTSATPLTCRTAQNARDAKFKYASRGHSVVFANRRYVYYTFSHLRRPLKINILYIKQKLKIIYVFLYYCSKI